MLDAVLSVYSFAGLVEESEEDFQEIKNLVISPSIICYCMMLAVYAKNERLDNAYSLLEEMAHSKKSNVVQAIGQLIQGDFDDESNWQIMDYVFDQINAQVCGFGMRFYNSPLEALWWLGQRARAARVLNEAFKRGFFPELFRQNKLLWSLDVHRMWPGSTSIALSIWLNDLYGEFKDRSDLPHVTSMVIAHGKMERDSAVHESPIAKAVLSFLETNLPPSSFSFSGWNEGRLICQRKQLSALLSALKESSVESDKGEIIPLSNSPLPINATVRSSYPNGRRDRPSALDADGTKTILNGTETALLPSKWEKHRIRILIDGLDCGSSKTPDMATVQNSKE
ncbi:Pentatricopeptide repeat-containing protein, partial [Drosera capensis]